MTNVTVVLYCLIITQVASDNVQESTAGIHLIQKKTRGQNTVSSCINLRNIYHAYNVFFLVVFFCKASYTIHLIGYFCFIQTLTSSYCVYLINQNGGYLSACWNKLNFKHDIFQSSCCTKCYTCWPLMDSASRFIFQFYFGFNNCQTTCTPFRLKQDSPDT